MHTVDGLVLEEELIVLGYGDEEKDGCDILKAMDPLLSFRTLSTNIEHSVGKVPNDECGLGNTSGLDTRSEDILVVWHIIRLCNAFNVVKVATSWN